MGLTGMRDLSLLQTPPQERVATETRVIHDTDEAVKTAIERELSRGGQVFYLYNRILTIDFVHRRLRRLFPKARIAVGHGQMPPREIEEIMRSFAAGEIDILLCTTIIENGVDIPRANTILIDRADRFGVADLYQLRGRVGRSSKKGYALFLIPDRAVLDSDARKRLEALQQHTGAGSGFHLSMQDLGIRGAGNILGMRQSGHIAAIGFTLYCQLLRQTVARMKGEKPPKLVTTEIIMDALDASPGHSDGGSLTCIPYSYIEEDSQRISTYRRLAECVTVEEVKALGDELADRYGEHPNAVRRLLKVTDLRIRASQANIDRVEIHGGEVQLFRNGAPLRINGQLPQILDTTVAIQLATLGRIVEKLGGKKK